MLSLSFELELSVSREWSVMSSQFARRGVVHGAGGNGARLEGGNRVRLELPKECDSGTFWPIPGDQWPPRRVHSRLTADNSRLTQDSSSALELTTVTALFQLRLTTRPHNSN